MGLILRRGLPPSFVLLAAAFTFVYFGLVHLPSGNKTAEEPESKNDQPGEAIKWIALGMKDGSGNIPRDGLMNAKRQMDAIRARQQRAFAGLKASELPSIAGINNGSWEWIGPGNIGGRTRTISVNPTNTNDIVAGGIAGGIWRTLNAGAHWNAVDDFMANLAVSSIVRKPNDASVLLAGTGEGFFNHGAILGAGVFRSLDFGQSWLQLGSTTNDDFAFVNRLTYSPDSSIVLAATGTGIWRSIDSGDSWIRVLSLPNVMTDVKFLSGSNARVVASGFFKAAYYSDDGGATWWPSAVPDGPLGWINRMELGTSVSDPHTVYASFFSSLNNETAGGELWKSVNSGQTYSFVSAPTIGGQRLLGKQGWYDNAIWIDPINLNHLIIGGVHRFRSTDGGVTFDEAGGNVHVDHHGIISDPGYNGASNRKVYFVNDGGIYRLEDSAGSTYTRLNNNYGVTQFYGGAGQNSTGRIFGGTQDNGTVHYTPAGGPQNWTEMAGGDGGFVTADQTNSNYVYGEFPWLTVHRSSNGGASSSSITGCSGQSPLEDACGQDPRANFISPILLDPNDPNLLYAGGQQLWRNNEARTSSRWVVVKAPSGAADNYISSIAIKVGHGNVVWVGHNNGDLYMTTNGIDSAPMWIKVDHNGLPDNRMATSIAIDPTNADVVYVTFGGYTSGNIWRTTNAGASWVDLSVGLPTAPIRSVALHPIISGWIYVGTDVGLFASEDSGLSWNLPHDGPANVAVFQVFFMNYTIIAVTHGRGMFRADTSTVPPSITQHPQDRTVGVGAGTVFTAGATGSPPPGLQWQRWNGSLWIALLNDTTYRGVTTTTLTVTAATVALGGSQYRLAATNVGGTAYSDIALLTVFTAGGNFVQNGDFSGGVTGWNVFEEPDIQWSIVGGAFQFYRASPTTTASGQAVVYQHTGVSLGERTGVSAQFDVGNSSSVRKRITVLLLDSDFSDLHVCTFFLGAGAPMRTYAMKTHSNQPWANAAIYFYAASGGSNGGNYLLDNVAVTVDPTVSFSRTDCIDPTAPQPAGGTSSANLLTNGDFALGAPGPWSIFGNLTWRIADAVFEFYKPNTTPPAGALLQAAGPMPAGEVLTATFQLGNISATRRRVTVLLNDADFTDLVACTFWLPAGQPLDTYTMRMFTTKPWGNALISFYPATPGAFQWAQLDNVTLQRTPAAVSLGTECVEPVPPFSQDGPKLVAPDAIGLSLQGISVALSADGRTAIVGGYRDNGFVGAAWVWVKSGELWIPQAKLVPVDVIGSGYAGSAVGLSADGNTAIVGNYSDSSAVVWMRSGGAWTQQGPKLTGSGGTSVSLSADGNTAVLGDINQNSASVWARTANVWSVQATLIPSDSAGPNPQLGRSVSVSADGSTAIVGADQDANGKGAAWVWTRNAGTWTQQGPKLVAAGAEFKQGFSVAISGDGSTAIVGAYAAGTAGDGAWVWTRTGGNWSQLGAKLVGSGSTGNADQGFSVSISADGNTALIGGWRDKPTGPIDEFGQPSPIGAFWFWTRTSGNWRQLGAKQFGSGAAGGSYQGYSVALSGDGATALVGGIGDGGFVGAIWIFMSSAAGGGESDTREKTRPPRR